MPRSRSLTCRPTLPRLRLAQLATPAIRCLPRSGKTTSRAGFAPIRMWRHGTIRTCWAPSRIGQFRSAQQPLMRLGPLCTAVGGHMGCSRPDHAGKHACLDRICPFRPRGVSGWSTWVVSSTFIAWPPRDLRGPSHRQLESAASGCHPLRNPSDGGLSPPEQPHDQFTDDRLAATLGCGFLEV